MKISKIATIVASTFILFAAGQTFAENKSSVERYLDKTHAQYRKGNITAKTFWNRLSKVEQKLKGLPKDKKIRTLLMQSNLLYENEYYILASIYAAQAIKVADDPIGKETQKAWKIISRVSQKQPIKEVVEILAADLNLAKTPPFLGRNWLYYKANHLADSGKIDEAIQIYDQIQIKDRYFLSAKYQQALLFVQKGDLDSARIKLKTMLYPTSYEVSPLPESQKSEIRNFAYLALGRLAYEEKSFANSINAYRMVDRKSPVYYDALFEQSWAMFMAGYPLHALGSLHSVESPFYENVFNPEAPLLRSMIYYWLCRYDDGKDALADFTEKYSASVEKLDKFLSRKRLTSQTSYQLFEDMVSGVSSESLGIPRMILETAAEKDDMLQIRDQYASVIEEYQRLESQGLYGSTNYTNKPKEYLKKWAVHLQRRLGKKFLVELEGMKVTFDRLYNQAQFLYLELMMSEKDKLLGKNLHASSKITKVKDSENIIGWGNKTQRWDIDENKEYWWDEVGFYISKKPSLCSE